MPQFLKEIIDFILYPKFEGALKAIRSTFLFFSGIFIAFIIWFLFNTSWFKRIFWIDFKEFIRYKPAEKGIFQRRWRRVKERISSGIEAELKLAIIEADEILDEALKNLGYREGTLTERLVELSDDIIPNIKDLQLAHQKRNAIVEDPSFRLSAQDAKKIMEIYEKSLEYLQAI